MSISPDVTVPVAQTDPRITVPTAASAVAPGLIERLLRGPICSPAAVRHPSAAPFDGSHLADIPYSTPADVDLAFATARRAQPRWAATGLVERSAIMLRFHDLLLARREEGLDLLQAETGKARRDALDELLDVCNQARHYARDAQRLLATHQVRGLLPVLTQAEVNYHPVGVVGIIAPWNYPLTLAVSDAIPALLAGNTVVLKPDHQTSLSALWAVDLMYQAGLPPRTFQVVLGRGRTLGPQIVDGCDYLMFTGSTGVGRELAAACGQRLIDCSMELGGKNPMIVRADANVEKAAEIAARACFSNTGQLCVSIERIYVDELIYEDFLGSFVNRVASLRLSPVVGWGSDMGSLINAAQLEAVSAHVEDAVAKGAQVATGGRARPDLGPYFYEPTVLTDVAQGMDLFAEETFGPVVSVYSFEHDDEALAAANESEFGLNASIITRDLQAGRGMAARLRTGTVNINEGYAAAWGSVAGPMGGMGHSGIGRRHGEHGLRKYTEEQTVATQRGIGLGTPSGWSNKTWGNVLIAAMAGMKRLGLK